MNVPPLDRKLLAILAADMVGYSKAMEADEALQHGIVSRIVPLEALDDTAMEMAAKIAAAPAKNIAALVPCEFEIATNIPLPLVFTKWSETTPASAANSAQWPMRPRCPLFFSAMTAAPCRRHFLSPDSTTCVPMDWPYPC